MPITEWYTYNRLLDSFPLSLVLPSSIFFQLYLKPVVHISCSRSLF